MLYFIAYLNNNTVFATTDLSAPNTMSESEFNFDIESGGFVEYVDDGFDLESQMSISTIDETRSVTPWSDDESMNTPPHTPRNTTTAVDAGDEEIVWVPDQYPVNLWTPPVTNTLEIMSPPRLIRMTNDNYINRVITITPRNLTEELMRM